MEKMLLNIGCGDVLLKGFINIDMDTNADLQIDVTKGLPFEDNSVDGIYSEHFIEHLSQSEGARFFRECRRVLKPDGILRIATPDLKAMIEHYIHADWKEKTELNKYGFGWIANPAEFLNISMREWGHKWIYDEEELTRLLKYAGFDAVTKCALNVSPGIEEFNNLETRLDSTLILETQKTLRVLSENPLVSVLMPVYKHEFLRTSLESALLQTYENIEIIISDDSENDLIKNIVTDLSKQYKNRTIQYENNAKRLNEIGNASKCVQNSSGELIKFLYDDDVLMPHCIETMVNYLKDNPQVSLVTSKRDRIDESGNILPEISATKTFTNKSGVLNGLTAIGAILEDSTNFIGEPSTVLFKREDLIIEYPDDIFSFAGRHPIMNGDVSMWMKLLSRGDLLYIAEPLSQFRIHKDQTQNKPEFKDKALTAWQQAIFDAERMGLKTKISASPTKNNVAKIKADSQNSVFSSDKEYQEKLNQEIAIYEQNTDVHNLPEIHNIYTGDFLVPSLQKLSGKGDWKEWWIKEIDEFVEKANRPVTILSLACGNGDLEIDLLKKLSHQNLITMVGVDVNPQMILRAQKMAQEQDLPNARFETQDLNFPNLSGPIDVVLANHSLHHLVELERLFAEIAAKASPDMIFLINDMIGRNGHVMWPNSELVMQKLWQGLDKKYKLNSYTKNYDLKPFNKDCSIGSFEGIRAQDILPLLVQYFDIEMFFPFSTIINRFTDRAYGHNFNVNESHDKKLILDILKLDIQLLKEKKLPPTQAFLRVQKKGTVTKMRYMYQTPQEAIAARQFAVPSDKESIALEKFASTGDQTKPLVSIVIPVFNNLEYTKACLAAIEKNTEYPNYELIIIDNASSDGTTEFLENQQKNGIRPIFNTENKGFVDACNQGAEASNGKYIFLLNNDTEVQPDWLNTLVQFSEENKDCGAIGSKLVYPDKTLQEAGGIIFSDGNGWNFGRGHNPDDLRFNFVREVDYCSGAALMVKNELWKKAGGLDRQYAPAYYEDTDMCFTVRKLGYKVYYHPHSTVIHYEGKTAGTDLTSGFKKYQKINHNKFVKKWKNELKHQLSNNPNNVVKASNRQATKNIIIFDPFLPMFDKASGSLRLFHILKLLREMKFHVTFIARNGSDRDKYKPILEKLGIMTLAWDIDAMRRAGVALKDIPANIDYQSFLKERFYDYAIIDFWDMAEFYVPIIRKHSPKTKIIIDSVDIHFIRELREAELKNDKILRQKALQNKKKELAVYKKADRVWVVTEEDRQALKGLIKNIPMDIVPNIHKKVDYMKEFNKTSGLLFVGNFNHPPNQDAVHFLIREIMPEVRKKLPDIKLIIAGNNPPQEIQDYTSDTTIVTGYVEDLSPYLQNARISVSPLRYGAGMKGKIGEALSWGLPVVTTSVGAEGIKLTDGEQALIADEATVFAEKIILLYQNAQLWKKLSVEGRRHVNTHWSPQVIKKTLSSVLGKPEIASGKKAEELVSIIMLTFNALEFTKKCIRSIQQHTKYPHEIIIVDNGSKDGTRKYLRELDKNFENIHIKLNKKNTGFSGGNNQGVKLAKGEYVYFLNNDVLVSDGWLESMVNALEADEKIGMVGPLTNSISGLQMVTNISYKDDAGFYKYAAAVRAQYAGKITPRRRIAGFAFIMRKELYKRLGGFDESFGIGNYEDDDLCIRVRQKGYAIMVDEGTFIHHFGSQTFKANNIDIGQSLDEKGKVFKEKWPDVDYEELLEMKNPLSKAHLNKMKKAANFISKGNFETAKAEYNSILLEHPLHTEALLGAALCSNNLKEFNEALTYLNKLIKLEPKNGHALNQAGLALTGNGDLESAKSSFALAVKNNPELIDAQRNYGDVLIETGEFEDGIRVFQTILKNHPDDIPALLYMSDIYLETGRLTNATDLIERVLQLDEKNELALQLKKVIESSAQKTEKDSEDSEHPGQEKTTTAASQIFCIAGMHRSGTSLLAQLLHANGIYMGDEERLMKGTEDNSQGYWENLEIVKINESLLSSFGLGWDHIQPLPDGWQNNEKIARLKSLALQLLEINKSANGFAWKDPRNSITFPFWKSLVPGLKVVVVYRNPLEVAHSLVRRNRMSIPRSLHLWHIYNQSIIDHTTDSERLFVNFDTLISNPEEEIERVLSWLEKPVDKELLKKSLSLVKQDLKHHTIQDWQQFRDENNQHIFELYENLSGISEIKPEPNTQQIQQANLLLEQGKHQEAVAIYKTVLGIDKRNFEALFGMAVAMQIDGDLKSSRDWLEKTLEIEDNFPAVYNMFGNIDLIEEKPQQAIEHYSRSLEIDASQIEIRNRLADALLMDEQYEQGIQLLLNTQKEFPQDTETLAHLGSVYLEAGRDSEAENLFRKVLELDPENGPVREYFSIHS